MRLSLILITMANLLLTIITIFFVANKSGSPNTGIISSAQAAQVRDTSDIRRTAIVAAAEKVSPAVVSIGAIRTTYVRRFDPFFHDFFAPYIVYPYKKKLPYLGSGVIINSDGYILTNYHVIEGAEKVLVTLVDGREFEAKILDADKVVDVAMLKIEGKNFPSAKLGNSDDIMIGEPVLAIGNPFGKLIEDPHPTVTAGVVSAIKRSFNPDPSRMRVYTDMIQTDASINPGNSGGPLINALGEVIGINTFIMSKSGGSLGIGFAIPINRARAVAKEIMAHGHIRPLWRDFDCVNLTPHLVRVLNAPDLRGTVVRRMERGGPAEECGLKVGDIIRKADGREVRSYTDLAAYFAAMQVGETLELSILRDGKPEILKYTIHEYKP